MKKNFSQPILFLSVFSLTVVMLWVYLSIQRALTKSEKPILTPQQTKILTPKFDQSVLEELKKRKF